MSKPKLWDYEAWNNIERSDLDVQNDRKKATFREILQSAKNTIDEEFGIISSLKDVQNFMGGPKSGPMTKERFSELISQRTDKVKEPTPPVEPDTTRRHAEKELENLGTVLLKYFRHDITFGPYRTLGPVSAHPHDILHWLVDYYLSALGAILEMEAAVRAKAAEEAAAEEAASSDTLNITIDHMLLPNGNMQPNVFNFRKDDTVGYIRSRVMNFLLLTLFYTEESLVFEFKGKPLSPVVTLASCGLSNGSVISIRERSLNERLSRETTGWIDPSGVSSANMIFNDEDDEEDPSPVTKRKKLA